MYPPKVIGVIGSKGKMATKIVIPLFQKAGYEVIGSDIKNPHGLTNREVMERADVVYFSIMPIGSVADVMRELIPFARKDTLWLHGTSIQNPFTNPIAPILSDQRFIENGTTVGYLHFMFGPSIQSLRGQTIIYGFPQDDWPFMKKDRWAGWLTRLLLPTKVRLAELTLEQHDHLTTGAQAIPQLLSLLTSHLYAELALDLLKILSIGGPPCWMQLYGMFRNLTQPEIIGHILAEHPHTYKVLKKMIETLENLKNAYERGEGRDAFLRMAEKGSRILSDERFGHISERIDLLIRVHGDLKREKLAFEFSPEENKLGLLTRVLAIIDSEGLDKTSCIAQELPSGGCIFIIGIKAEGNDPRVNKSQKRVRDEVGGKFVIYIDP